MQRKERRPFRDAAVATRLSAAIVLCLSPYRLCFCPHSLLTEYLLRIERHVYLETHQATVQPLAKDVQPASDESSLMHGSKRATNEQYSTYQ